MQLGVTLSVQVELFLGRNLRAKIGVQKLPDHDRGVQEKQFALCTIFLYFPWINRALSSIVLFFPPACTQMLILYIASSQ